MDNVDRESEFSSQLHVGNIEIGTVAPTDSTCSAAGTAPARTNQNTCRGKRRAHSEVRGKDMNQQAGLAVEAIGSGMPWAGFPTTVRADVLHHARSHTNGGNVHRVQSVIQAYVFACEDLQNVQEASLLMPRSPNIRRRLMQARAGVERMEAQLWAV